jgi:hypothetical protein
MAVVWSKSKALHQHGVVRDVLVVRDAVGSNGGDRPLRLCRYRSATQTRAALVACTSGATRNEPGTPRRHRISRYLFVTASTVAWLPRNCAEPHFSCGCPNTIRTLDRTVPLFHELKSGTFVTCLRKRHPSPPGRTLLALSRLGPTG